MPVPTERRRHAEALLHAGHSDTEIRRRTGLSRNTVARYRKQLGLPGYLTRPDSPACRYGHPFPENRAFRPNGWLYCRACNYPPGQADEMAVERAVAGEPPEALNFREIAAAIARLDTGDLSAAAIAARIHCTTRTVERHRARRREAA